MRILDYFNPRHPSSVLPAEPVGQYRIVVVKRLRTILEFTGLTINDVVNCPIAKNQVRGYWKLARHIDRRSETLELERQWNAVGA